MSQYFINSKQKMQAKIKVGEYIKREVNHFVQPMVCELVKKKPDDPITFAIEFLQSFKKKMLKLKQQDYSDDSDEDKDIVNELQFQQLLKKYKHKKKSRLGISQEVIGKFNKKEVFEVEDIPKTEEIKFIVRNLIRNSILFQNVDSKDEQVILESLKRRETDEHQMIIKENQQGSVLYIVESGEYDCYKMINQENNFIKTYQLGQTFGELALMYNAPRAATIVTKVPGSLLVLDRATFSQVLKVSALRKRQILKQTIDKIQMFNLIENQQREHLIDLLKQEKFGEGEEIIKQGQTGNKFYIVLEGTLVAEKIENEFPEIVYKYQTGDYFGELSLIHDINRQATVKAISHVKLASISREGFKRAFGKLQAEFIKKTQKYIK